MNSDVETAELFTASNLNALRGLAKSRKVDLELVLKAAAEDRLVDIVTMRDRRIRPALPGWGVTDPLDALAVLRCKEAVFALAIHKLLAD
jgi:hypothetical protein